MDKHIIEKLAKIAEENISALEGRGDLEARRSDDLDFFETSVWSLKAALVEAFELGRKAGEAGVKPLSVKYTRGESRPFIDAEAWEAFQAKMKEQNGRPLLPLGYKRQGDRVVMDEEEAEVVKRAAAEMAKNGKLTHETETDLRRAWKKHYQSELAEGGAE